MLIKLSGREPKSFDDRIAMAQECQNKADYIGAYVECGSFLVVEIRATMRSSSEMPELNLPV